MPQHGLRARQNIRLRLAEDRQIPAVKVEDEWVFSRKSLQKWQRLQTRRGARA